MYLEKPLQDYLADAASNLPAPGGGSVSALVAAQGVSMLEMACNFTVGKKKYADVQDKIKGALNVLSRYRSDFCCLMEQDIKSYVVVSQAYKMPKDSDEEKATRTRAIQDALVIAMEPPLKTAQTALAVLQLARELVDITNANLISDIGVGTVLVESAMRGAVLNVEVNLGSLKDEKLVGDTRKEIDAIQKECATILNEVWGKVTAKIK